MDADAVKFVVGLGNPGSQYARTRHNAGFMVVEELARRWAPQAPPRRAFDGQLYDVRVRRAGGQRRLMMLQPLTYMNRSGQAVSQMLAFYKAQAADVLVVLDDFALPLGRLRARAGGSAGGHNGLSDVLRALGTQDVPRLRIGVGSPPPPMDAADYVLAAFAPAEMELVGQTVDRAADAVEDWAAGGIEAVMNNYNRDDAADAERDDNKD